ncbi:MAG: hypothetical protein WB983_03735 [Terriglobales bacterium]
MPTPSPSQFDQVAFGMGAFVEVVKNLCEITAIAMGGIWTYFNFFKGRTYKSRLECEVNGTVEIHSGQSWLKIVMKTKNVGRSKVPIGREGTVLQVQSAVVARTPPRWPMQANWREGPAVWGVFGDHDWLEPSEPIEDHLLIELPDDKTPAYRLTLRVLSGNLWWTATNVVQSSEKNLMKGGGYESGSGSGAGRPE